MKSYLLAIPLILFSLDPAGFAAKAQKPTLERTIRPEVYRSLEDVELATTPIEPRVEPLAKPETTPQPKLQVLARPKRSPKELKPKKLKMDVITASELGDSEFSKSAEAFDLVPSDQVSLIVKRLKLVELLVARHARAYDYRALTIKELESRLSSLESIKRKESLVPTGSAGALDSPRVSRVEETEPLPEPPQDPALTETSRTED